MYRYLKYAKKSCVGEILRLTVHLGNIAENIIVSNVTASTFQNFSFVEAPKCEFVKSSKLDDIHKFCVLVPDEHTGFI